MANVDLSQYDVIVDGIFGNGLAYPIEKTLQQFIYHVNNSSAYKVSIDIPTNINADLGILDDEAFKADLTITFMCYKKAMLNLNLAIQNSRCLSRQMARTIRRISGGCAPRGCAAATGNSRTGALPSVWNMS